MRGERLKGKDGSAKETDILRKGGATAAEETMRKRVILFTGSLFMNPNKRKANYQWVRKRKILPVVTPSLDVTNSVKFMGDDKET